MSRRFAAVVVAASLAQPEQVVVLDTGELDDLEEQLAG
jgi:hypothetical protein